MSKAAEGGRVEPPTLCPMRAMAKCFIGENAVVVSLLKCYQILVYNREETIR